MDEQKEQFIKIINELKKDRNQTPSSSSSTETITPPTTTGDQTNLIIPTRSNNPTPPLNKQATDPLPPPPPSNKPKDNDIYQNHPASVNRDKAPVFGKKPSKGNVITGQSKPPKTSLFVGGFNPQLPTNQIKSIIEEDTSIQILGIQPIHNNRHNQSVRIDINVRDKEKAFNANTWIEGLIVKPYRHRSKQSNRNRKIYNEQDYYNGQDYHEQAHPNGQDYHERAHYDDYEQRIANPNNNFQTRNSQYENEPWH